MSGSVNFYLVAVESPLQPLTYHSDQKFDVGAIVHVPLGKSKVVKGVVISTVPTPSFKTKEIIGFLYQLNSRFFSFLQWLANYYHYPLGEVLRASSPKDFTLKELKLKTGAPQLLTLNADQERIFQTIMANPDKPHLIHGVTGSGKTEVYSHIILETMKKNQQTIFLVPEISLTAALHSRLEERLGLTIPIVHSGISEVKRKNIYLSFAEGKIPILLGARSLVLYPSKNLGLIVIDEEHDGSYKQDARLLYHGRDAAIYRAHQEKALVVLGSATPSLESYHNCQTGKYHYHDLPTRARESKLPTIELVDLRKTKLSPGKLVTPPLQDEIRSCLEQKKQCIIYLGRRGYANILLCGDCGVHIACKHCAIPMTYYKRKNQLLCHLCGSQGKVPVTCPTCKSESLEMLGGGTEALEQELKELFPEASIDRLDRSIVTSQTRLQTVVDGMNNRTTDILIGTQMITKGYDFPHVTLVCVILADLTLFSPDFRALEKSLQLLSQVSGRAGRGADEGKVLIQTYNPDHPLFGYLIDHDVKTFFSHELESREKFSYPPFSFLVDVRSEGKNEHALHRSLTKASDFIKKNFADAEILGPAPETITKVKDLYRYHFVIKAKTRHVAQRAAAELAKFEAEERLILDVDPY